MVREIDAPLGGLFAEPRGFGRGAPGGKQERGRASQELVPYNGTQVSNKAQGHRWAWAGAKYGAGEAGDGFRGIRSLQPGKRPRPLTREEV